MDQFNFKYATKFLAIMILINLTSVKGQDYSESKIHCS